jgi:large subunit ribosomal protein L29
MVVIQMKVKEIRELSTEEIVAKIKENKEELFNLRFQQATGNLEKPSRIRDLRHTVARMKTVLKERENAE